MKKILYLSLSFPYPADSGGKIKTYGTLQLLAQRFDVTAVFLTEKKVSLLQRRHLTKKGITSNLFIKPQIKESVKENLFKLVKNFAHFTPYYVYQYAYPDVKIAIAELITQLKPDVIHVDHITMAQYLPSLKNQVWVLEQHNVESELIWSRFQHTQPLRTRAYLWLEWLMTFWFERQSLKKFDHIWAISDHDQQRLQTLFKVKNISTQTLLMPTHSVDPKRKRPKKSLLFIGGLSWPPNKEAIKWFLKEIFPVVLKKAPATELHIVGEYQPQDWSSFLKLPQVHFHGYQPSLAKFLRVATAFVLPFKMGGGVRIKALTAMVNHIPIVSTPLGVQGLKVVTNREVLVANNSVDFARVTSKLLNSEKLQAQLIKQAQIYLRQNHGLSEKQRFLKEYEAVIKRYDSV